MLGVSRQPADQLSRSYADFPEPEARLSVGRVWLREAVERWVAAHQDPAARPPALTPT